MRCILQMVIDIYQFRHFVHDSFHLFLDNTTVFQGKGNILSHRKPDELPVRVLKHRAHSMTQFKNTAFAGLFAAHCKFSRAFPRISKRNQSVNATSNGAFTASRSACNQHFFSGINLQIDMMQGRFCLRRILKSIILKRNDGLCHDCSPLKKDKQIQKASRLPNLLTISA